tara:strand:- start:791 stop:1531 length:741 start_codon:yes stop_codon:yes gene_type:complete
MYRYQILVEYDGSSYIGWQKQKKGISIQGTLEKTLTKVLKEKIILQGSGRTDAGVHALEHSSHFDIKTKIKKIDTLIKSLNFFLKKKNISILSITKKRNNFHARFSAKERIYKYIILNRLSPSSINNGKVWHITKKLDIKKMKEGSKFLEGTHDFSAFRSSSCNAKSAIRTIRKITIKKNNKELILRFKSQSFLHQQVRSMVGCLKYLGENKWDLIKFNKVIKSKKRILCAPPAPAEGLFLEKIIY